MEPLVLWQHKWSQDLFVPGYLFFGGLTAGLVIVAVLADLLAARAPGLKTLSRRAAYTAVVTMALGGALLTYHLGKPERGLGFPLFFTNYDSWMTRGGWILGAVAPLVFLYAALWYFAALPGLRRAVGGVLIPLSALFAMYTGFLLSGAGYVPVWSKRFLPLLFLNSGLTTGTAAAGLVALAAWPFAGRGQDDPAWTRRAVAVLLAVLLLAEAWELRAYVTYLAERAPDKALAVATPSGQFVAPMGSRLAHHYLTGGPGYPWKLLGGGAAEAAGESRPLPTLAPLFWLGVVGVGLALPLLLTALEVAADARRSSLATGVALAKFALVLIGGFLLRVVIVRGGDLKALLPFPPQLFQVPRIELLPVPPALPPIPGAGG